MYRSMQGQLGTEITSATELELMRFGCSRWPLPLHNQSLPILWCINFSKISWKPGLEVPWCGLLCVSASCGIGHMIASSIMCSITLSHSTVGRVRARVCLVHHCGTAVKRLHKGGVQWVASNTPITEMGCGSFTYKKRKKLPDSCISFCCRKLQAQIHRPHSEHLAESERWREEEGKRARA